MISDTSRWPVPRWRYTGVDRHGAPLAMIGMAAAAWKTAPRDHAIGWSPETRARNLHLVVNQSRLLLLPWIVIPNLGSHILSMLRRQLPGDWTQRYNVEPVLIGNIRRNTALCRHHLQGRKLDLYRHHQRTRTLRHKT